MGARELLNDLASEGLSVIAEGDRLVIRPGLKLTDPVREALRDAKLELLALLSPSAELRSRPIRWGRASLKSKHWSRTLHDARPRTIT